MPCYHPIPAESVYDPHTKKRTMKLHAGEPTHWLPCGKCLGCREVTQQQLAIRVHHEARYYTDKHFLTLTYDEEKCPPGIQHRDMQLLWKRVRKHFAIKTKVPGKRPNRQKTIITPRDLKHLTCGEYGDRTQRPHYHAAVLGLPLNDLRKWDSENHTSETLTNLWGNGIVTVSELTFDRIKYVAGYVLKKAGYRKQIYITEDGEELEPPYRHMSQGLGERWVTDYGNDLRLGYLQHDGAKYAIPRYYMDRISTNDRLIAQIQESRAKTETLLTPEEVKCRHNGEKIRQKRLRDLKHRDKI